MNPSGRALLLIVLPVTPSSQNMEFLSPLLSIKHANNLIHHLSRIAFGDNEEEGRRRGRRKEGGRGGGGGGVASKQAVLSL